MRPRRLISVRANRGRRLSAHGFRAIDVVALAFVTVLALQRSSPVPVLDTPLGQVIPLVVGGLVLSRMLQAVHAYRFVRSARLGLHLVRLVIALGVALLALTVAEALVGWLGGSATVHGQTVWWAATAGLVITVLHLAWWFTARAWRAAGWLTPNLVVVGATEYAETVIRDALERRNVNVLGVFDDRIERSPEAIVGVPVLGDLDALLAHKITPFVDRIVIAVEPHPTQRVLDIATRLSRLPNDITFFMDEEGSSTRVSALDRLGDAPLSGCWPVGRDSDVDRNAFAKRMQDLLVAIPMLLLATPFMLLIAVLVKLDSRGPVFFRQHRHGFNNEDILVWKFRSMHPADEDDRNQRQVVADDDRVTRVGRFLRGTSLDELPQLINVVRGEMSLVGPRPHPIGMKTGEIESAVLVATYAHRHRIKPGMTGWAAVQGSRGPVHTPEDVRTRVALDVEYIGRRSLMMDVSIMLRTLPTMLGDRHATR